MAAKAFVGRSAELRKLDGLLTRVRKNRQGAFLSVRGRRQVGKSRLLEEFIRRSGAKAVFFTASQQGPDEELESLRLAIAASRTDAAGVAADGSIGSWEAALALLGGEATRREPVVVVIDEFPYLTESVPAIEGILQKTWDRTLEGCPVLLVVVGSDISTMEALTTYGRPLYGRAGELVVSPLSPAEVGEMLALEPAAALNAYLVLGGFPRLAARWERGDDLWRFLKRELAEAESPLVVLGERTLAAEFRGDVKARDVLRAIGSGERAHKALLTRSGVSQATLEHALRTLVEEKRVVTKSLPYSAEPRPKLSRYSVADPYLRFWLRFIAGAIPTLERGRGDLVLAAIRESWPMYQGRAIEPVIRTGIERLLPDRRFGGAQFVGSWWTRDNQIEVDLVGGREPDQAGTIDFIGSIKWRGARPFGKADLAELTARRASVPGTKPTTRLVAVSRSGFDAAGLDVALSPADIVAAY